VAGSQANAGLALISSIVIARLLIPRSWVATAGHVDRLPYRNGDLAAGRRLLRGDASIPARAYCGPALLECGLGLIFWALLSIGALIYAHQGGDAEMAGLLILGGSVMVTNSFTSLNAYFTRELEYRNRFWSKACPSQ